MMARTWFLGSLCFVLGLATSARSDFLTLSKSSGLTRTIAPNSNPAGPPFQVSYGPSSGVVSYNNRTNASQAELDKFDLSSLAGSQILSATLSFSIYLAIPTGGNTVNLSLVGRGATSPTVTSDDFSSNNPTITNTSVALAPVGTTATPVNLDQTAALQTLIDGGFASIAYLFTATTPGNVSFTSPVLNVTYQAGGAAVPEPSSLVLACLGGLTAMGGWRLRRR